MSSYGVYTLVAANQVGSADQGVELIQGPQGPQGPIGPNLSGDQIVDLINSGSTPIQFGHLAGVAPLAHTHDAADIATGTLDVAQLPAHDHYEQGMMVNMAMVQTRTQATYPASNSGTGTSLTPLELTITPKKAGNRVILEWVVHGEANENVLFLAQRNGTPLPDATNPSGNRWAGIATSDYDQNQASTPHNMVIRIIDMNSLASESTYSVHVRSSNNTPTTYYFNRTVASLGQDSYESGLSTGTATEIWW